MTQYYLQNDIAFNGALLRRGKLIDDSLYSLATLSASGAVLVLRNAGADAWAASIAKLRARGGDPAIDANAPLPEGAVLQSAAGGQFAIQNVATPVNPTDAANKAYVDASAGSVTGTAPIVVAAGNVSISAATEGAAGSMSAADKTKLDNLATTPTGTGYAHVTGGTFDGAAQDFVSVGSTLGGGYHPASNGVVRLPNSSAAGPSVLASAAVISARDVGNANDRHLASFDTSNIATFGDSNAQCALYGNLINFQSIAGLAGQFSVTSPFSLVLNVPLQLGQNLTGGTLGYQSPYSADIATHDLTVNGQGAHSGAVTNVNGGNVHLQSGRAATNGTSGRRGAVRLELGEDTADSMLEAAEPVLGQRVLALCQRGSGVTSTQMPASTGDGVAYWANAGTVPSANAVGGGIQYANAGAGTWRGSGGTVTSFGPA